MTKTSKYKIFLDSKKIADILPKRIKSFKRTKWKNLKFYNRYKSKNKLFNLKHHLRSIRFLRIKVKLIHSRKKAKRRFRQKFKRYIRNRYRFKNFFSPTVENRDNILKMRYYLKNSLFAKKKLNMFFDKCINFSIIKKNISYFKSLSYINLIKVLLIKQNYNLRVLLWKLHFYSNTLEVSKAINSNLIFVNNNAIKSNCFLKNGDVIEIKENSLLLNLKKNLHLNKMYSRFYSFVEVDYYTSTIVIIKDFQDLNMDDFCLLIPFSKYFDVNKLHNYIR